MKFIYTISVRKYFSLFFLTLATLGAQAQSAMSNPYSRFGIGIIDPPGSVNHFAMGGVSSVVADPNNINLYNPASYATLGRTTLQLGGKGVFQTISSDTESETYRSGQVSEVAFAFKKSNSPWGFVIGVTPYSTVGYNITSSSVINDSTSTINRYDGSGGFNRLVIGGARSFRLYKKVPYDNSLVGSAKVLRDQRVREVNDSLYLVSPKLSVGFNVNYFFGNIRNERRIQFNSTRFYGTKETAKLTVFDFDIDAGLQYLMPLSLKWDQRKIKSGVYLTAGLNYLAGTKLKARYEESAEMYLFSNQIETEVDTTFSLPTQTGTFDLPQRISGGLGLFILGTEGKVITINTEYRIQDWSNFSSSFTNAFSSSGLDRFQHIGLGFEITPKGTEEANNIFERTTYRFGVRQTDSYLRINDIQVQQQAVSAGFSVPIMSSKSASRFNLGVEYATGGSTENNLLREELIHLHIGFTLTPHFLNPWFVERKYD